MSTTHPTQIICYWPDGYWITDPEEATLLDSVNAFGCEHRMLEVPEGQDIQKAVNTTVNSLSGALPPETG